MLTTLTGRCGSASSRVDLTFGSVALFEADRVAQSGHRLLEILVLDGGEAISAASASA